MSDLPKARRTDGTEACEPANPWGLTVRQAQTLDAMVEHGCPKRAARVLGLSHRTVQNYSEHAAHRMNEGGSRIRCLILWDRWRQTDGKGVPA